MLLVGAIALAGSAAAAEGKDKNYYPPKPQPAPAIAALGALSGIWVCDGAMPAGAIVPGTPETKYRSSFKISPLYDGQAYSIAYEQRFIDSPMVFAGTWYAGWDNVAKALNFFWLDNMGTVGRETSSGWDGNMLRLAGEGVAHAPAANGAAASQLVMLRDTFTRTGEKILHWKGEMKFADRPGWTVLGDDDCRRE